MHIPENYLSPSTCAVMTVAMVPVWARAIKKVNAELPKEKIPMIGVGAAFSFLGMMFNIPLPGGTTGHAVGGTLIALLLGPDAACLAVTIALLIQALLFGDGGILAFGANCFNMAFLLPYVGYYVYKLIVGNSQSQGRKIAGAAFGSYLGINVAALAAAIEFGIQPYLFTDAAGQALYCPYGLGVAIPSMLIGHLTIFGLAEVIYTVAIYSFVNATAKQEQDVKKTNKKAVYILMAALIALVPLGLIAEGTAWGEWGADEIMEITGLSYVPSGLENGWALESIFPDYTMAGIPDVAAYILSAIVGVAIAIILFRLFAAAKKEKTDYGTI
ncbi:MAG: cobalt transporter CbiM [Pseudobutyrivibrio sp.]|nr:cobalt transporter CbiM [Pseudobutyrivibrio sp.]